ncbi:MAG: phosphatase PAP2 family protein [Bacteroidales bacterium]|nr:phosphatase PAP2 family protein [Bacteroidales bacterium]
MIDWLNNLDHAWTLAINSVGAAGGLDGVARFFSKVQVWYPLYAVVLALIYWRIGWKKGIVATLALVLCVLGCDQGANFFKDVVFMRLRPCFDEWMIANGVHVIDHYPDGYFYGFFSGHASNCFGFALLSSLLLSQDKRVNYWWYKVVIFIWAALVALSRIICGKHFLGDILVGAIFGLAVAYIIFLLYKFVCKKLAI